MENWVMATLYVSWLFLYYQLYNHTALPVASVLESGSSLAAPPTADSSREHNNNYIHSVCCNIYGQPDVKS